MTKNEAIITGFSKVASSGGDILSWFPFFEKRYNALFFPAQLKPLQHYFMDSDKH